MKNRPTTPTLTDWFPACDVQPARAGFYDYRFSPDSEPFNALWDGKVFRYADGSRFDSLRIPRFATDQWRGLAQPPG